MENMFDKKININCDIDSNKVYNYGDINKCYEISGCGQNVNITLENIIPGKKADYWGEDYLCFYWRCPKCLMVHELHEKYLDVNTKLYLMKKYALQAEETYKIWIIEKIRKDLLESIAELSKEESLLKNKIFESKLFRDNSKLFSNWEETEKILKLEK